MGLRHPSQLRDLLPMVQPLGTLNTSILLLPEVCNCTGPPNSGCLLQSPAMLEPASHAGTSQDAQSNLLRDREGKLESKWFAGKAGLGHRSPMCQRLEDKLSVTTEA